MAFLFTPITPSTNAQTGDLSEKGQDTYSLLREVQDPWAIENTEDIPIEELETTLRLVRRLIKKFN